MLYYRTRNAGSKNRFTSKLVPACFLLLVWASWIVSSVPCHELSAVIFSSPKEEILSGEIILSVPTQSQMANKDFTEPAVGVLTSPFGERWGRVHEGIDIGGEHGSDILAAESGVVLLSQWVDGYGNYIEIDHGNDFTTAYGHCNELRVSAGDYVGKGDVIATMGNTGNSTGPHLHFEILLHEEPQNPLNYVIY